MDSLYKAVVSVELDHVDVMQDLGVAIDDDLSFDGHINEKVVKAFQILGEQSIVISVNWIRSVLYCCINA